MLATRLRLGWRDRSLLARFDCRHAGTTATLARDNDALWKEDVVEAFVALADPPVDYFEFEANPLGAKFSARVSSPNRAREGMAVETFECPGFSVRVAVRPHVWSALLRVPLEALSGRPVERLRANFFRIDRKSGEFQALFPTHRSPPDFHVPGAFGEFEIGP